MQFSQKKRGKYLIVNASGRLDASWADHFLSVFKEHIRRGHHHIMLDAPELTYLSSAGIRALVQLARSVAEVNGSFQILKANSFVEQTLTTTGFGNWLTNELPSDMPPASDGPSTASKDGYETHPLEDPSPMLLSIPAAWKPWERFSPDRMVNLRFGLSDFALGIGAPKQANDETGTLLGEFLAVGGHVVYQPPHEGERPDFLLAEKEYVPEMHCIQALHCSGGMSHLIRFAPTAGKSCFQMGEVAERALLETQSSLAALVVLAEIDGLVGSTMIKTPGLLNEDRSIPFPELKEWLSFCGERVYSRQKALVFGLAAKGHHGKTPLLLKASNLHPGLFLHLHAAVIPYQPLESGVISLRNTVQKFLNGPSPLALLHLVEDSRPAAGLGESAFVQGVCWCAAIKNVEEDALWES